MQMIDKEAFEAAEKLKDYCTGRNCLGCMFSTCYADCILYEDHPCDWELNEVEDGETD